MGFLSDLIGGKHKTVPTSSSESSAFQRSTSGSFQTGSSQAVGSSVSRSVQDVFGSDLYKALFGNATNAAARASELVPGLQGASDMLFSAGGRFLQELEGDLATEDRLADDSFETDQINQLQSDLGRFFEEEIDPRITSRGVATGTLGGSRGEVARGIASRSLGEEFVRGSTAIRLAGQERKDRLATTVDTLKAGRAGQGIAGASSLYGLAESGVGAELAPYLQLSQILGGPTVLTQSGSQSETESVSSQLARAFSESLGESQSKSSGSTVTKGPGLLDVLDTLSKFA